MKNLSILKQSQTIVALLLIALMSLSFGACSKDDDDEGGDLSKTVIGAWSQDGDDDILVIKSDGTGAWYDNEEAYLNDEGEDPFIWKIEGDCMRFYDDGKMYMELRPESVSKNKIVWKRYDLHEDHLHWPNEFTEDSYGYYSIWTWERFSK